MKVGLMGYGTVGRAFVEALADNQEHVTQRVGEPVSVGRILVRHPDRHRGAPAPVTTDPEELFRDASLGLMVEVMGGFEPARTYIIRALESGRSVVTANKEVVSRAGQELFEAAERGGASLFFEASVGGGMPVVQGLKVGLQANRLASVEGILNGTTNYILSRMTDDGLDFSAALRAAQEAGYAEADPTNDLKGLDAVRKLAILASIGFGVRVLPDEVDREGIEAITADDIRFGLAQGWRLKLVAEAAECQGTLTVRVGPRFLPLAHPLAAVSGPYNAVLVHAEPVGTVMFYGPGAGGPATASAVLGDVMEASSHLRSHTLGIRCTCYRSLPLTEPGSRVESAYLRLLVADRPGTLAEVAEQLAHAQVSVRTLQQEAHPDGAVLYVVTHPAPRAALTDARQRLASLPVVRHTGHSIPVTGDRQ
jgi:homoserine dehydrogenase